jgi:glycosyltransferase involved in cell wall biosynthesis
MFAPVGKLVGVKTVLWYAHGAVPFALKVAERLVDACVTSTAEGFRLPSSKLSIIGQGVEPELWPQPAARGEGDAFRIISVGRLGPSKGIDILLEAAAYLRAEISLRVYLDIVGDATNQAETEHAALLRACALDLGVDAVFHGRKTPADVARLLARADVFVAMSSTGSLDKAIVEAMMSGCPVVSSNDAFAAIARRIGVEVCIVDRNAGALCDRLAGLSRAAPAARSAIAAKLREAALSEHTLQALMGRLMSVLEACAATGPAHAKP